MRSSWPNGACAGLDHLALLMGFTHLLVTIGYLILSKSLQWTFAR